MTEKQFEQLKIGDKVMNSSLTKVVTVQDINRPKGLVNTGGAWRKYRGISMSDRPVLSTFTRLEPVTQITLPVKMLKRYPLIDVVTIETIRRAGTEGFIGTNETLRNATQICTAGISMFTLVILRLSRDGLITRERLAHSTTRFMVNEEKLKQYQ